MSIVEGFMARTLPMYLMPMDAIFCIAVFRILHSLTFDRIYANAFFLYVTPSVLDCAHILYIW